MTEAWPQKPCEAGLRPTQTLWAACGRVQIGPFKTRRQCFVHSSLASPLHHSPTRERTEVGPLDSRLNIGWDKLSRRIQDFVKAVTSQNQQRNDAFHLNAEPGDRWWEKGFLRDVTQHQRAAEISKEPGAPKQSHRRNTNQPTWHPRQRIGHFREATRGTNKIFNLLNQRKASITNKISITELWIDLYAVAFLMLVIFLLV